MLQNFSDVIQGKVAKDTISYQDSLARIPGVNTATLERAGMVYCTQKNTEPCHVHAGW